MQSAVREAVDSDKSPVHRVVRESFAVKGIFQIEETSLKKTLG